MKLIIAPEYDGMQIRDYLREVHDFSRRILKSIKQDGGQILVNDIPQTVRFLLTAGDVLTVRFAPEEVGAYMHPEEITLNILYEDDAVIVIDKPAGMAVIPSFNHSTGTVANALLAYYVQKGITSTVHIVTRLDRDTSGLCLIAKNRYSHSLLSAAQKKHKVKRKYQAIVEGYLGPKQGTIDLPIGRKEGSIIERAVVEDGKRAVTHYEVVVELKNYSFVNIELETGRTHQIRVHFSHIGHPLAGDDLYGGGTLMLKRQALHCYAISFEHPFTKEILHFQSKIPDDFRFILL